VDCLAKVLGVIRAPKGPSEAGGGEGESQHLAIELGHLGIRFHQGPRAAFDLGQRLQDFRPSAT
jgi:hypothetical protein